MAQIPSFISPVHLISAEKFVGDRVLLANGLTVSIPEAKQLGLCEVGFDPGTHSLTNHRCNFVVNRVNNPVED